MKVNFSWKHTLLLTAFLSSACDDTTDLMIEKSGSTFTFDMSKIEVSFDEACFVNSEYNQFHFGSQPVFLSKERFIPRNPNQLVITPSDISRRGFKYLKRGYNSQYVLMVLKTGSSYEALPIYGPKIEGKNAVASSTGDLKFSIGVKKYNSPNSCTTNKNAVARCTDFDGSSCYMLFDNMDKEGDAP